MKHARILLLLATLGAVTLAACGKVAPSGSHPAISNAPASVTPVPNSDSLPANSPTTPATAAQSAASGSPSVKAFIDPITGELREPTEAEQKAAAASAATANGNASVKANLPVQGTPLGNGMIEYEIGKRGMVDEVACVQKDGTVGMHCPPPAGKSN